MRVNRLSRIVLAAAALVVCRVDAGVGILTGDTYVTSALPTNNFGSASLINVNSTSIGLVQLDLTPSISGMLLNMPGAAQPFLGKATLTVYVNKVVTSGTLQVAPLAGSWTESGVTYNTAPAQGSVAGSLSVSTANQFVTLDVTSIVQNWLTPGGSNFGFALSTPDGGSFVIDSKEATATSHQATLNIEYATGFQGVLRKDLTLNSPGFTSLFSILLTGTNTAGGRVFYTIRATDGGSQLATEEGVIQFAATTNSITCTVQTADKLHLGTVGSGCTPGFFNPGSHPGISVFDNVSFSSPAPIVVHEVFFRIENISGAAIRLEP